MKTKLRARIPLSIAASSLLALPVATPAVYAETNYTFQQESITFGGTQIASFYGLTAGDTTYLPMWYLNACFKQLGVTTSWDGSHWDLTADENVDTTNPDVSSTGIKISINGTVVMTAPFIVYGTPGSRALTTYVPSASFQEILQRLGISCTQSGTQWSLTASTPVPSLPSLTLGTKTISTDNGYTNHDVAGFFRNTEYLDFSAVQDALTAFGVRNTLQGNDWYLGEDPATGTAVAAFDPSKPVLIHAAGIPDTSADITTFQGKSYVTIYPVLCALKSLGDYPAWDGASFHLGHLPQAHPVVNPYQTYSYAVMQRDIQTLQSMYPDLIQVKTVGKTVYGRNIYAIGLGKGKASVFINGAHHAREWITAVLNMYMLDRYALAYRNDQSIEGYNVRQELDQTTIWFIPMVNPDGVTLEQFGAGAFPASARASLIRMNNGKTNFLDWKANAQGIDPNRQYNGGWAGIWVYKMFHPWYENYKGTAPYQINEAKAVLNLIRQVNPQEEIAYHASGNIMYWEYKVTGSKYNEFLGLAHRMQHLTGYSLVMPGPNPSGGGLTDWWTGTVGRPGFTIEVGPACGESPVPTRYFSSIWNQNQAVGLELASEGYQRYVTDPNSVVHVP